MDDVTMQDAGLGATIRAWRDRLAPSAVGLPSGRNRRTAGLRREELAGLAGVSVDYLVRLEQGRATAPSPQVAAALARALQLSDAERDHLYRLAKLAPPAAGRISDHIHPGVQRLVSRFDCAPVAVFAADWRMLWWNRAWAAVVGDPSGVPADERNFALTRFGGGRLRLNEWPVHSSHDDDVDVAVVSDLRRATGRFPDDPRLAALIRQLTERSPRFAEIWSSGAVGAHREDRKTIEHPVVGALTVDCDTLTDGESELKIVMHTAVPGSEDETKLQLAMVAGDMNSPAVR